MENTYFEYHMDETKPEFVSTVYFKYIWDELNEWLHLITTAYMIFQHQISIFQNTSWTLVLLLWKPLKPSE